MRQSNWFPAMILACAALSVLAFSPNCWAQQSSATIVGTVTDPSGAAIPNATITVVNPDTGFKRVLVSNSVGAYTIAGLVPGAYNVTAEASGFQRLVQAGVTLTVGQTQRVDMQLKVGQATQEVTVQANVPHVQTESASVSTAIVGKQIQDLEVNGQNIMGLTTLVPGAAPVGAFGNGGIRLGHSGAVANVSYNGTRSVYSNVELDGGNNADEGSGANSNEATPSLDMIQEFRISTSNYGADQGQHAGAIIEFVTKSGTNQFHGDLHEFLRNDAVDANDWFLNRQINPPGANAPKTPLKWNTFGGTFGGPFYIPGLYKKGKTYFFYSQQFARYRQGSVISGFVPSVRMRGGDFSECDASSPNANSTIISQGCTVPTDPTSGNHFAGDIVPVNPNATALLDGFVPLPNNGVDGYVSSLSAPENYHQESIRVDQNISSKASMFVRWTHDYDDNSVTPALWSGSDYDTTATDELTTATSAVLHFTYLFKPTLMSEFIMGYSDDPHDYEPLAGPGSPAHSVIRPSSFQMKSIFPGNQNNTLLPGISVDGGLPSGFFVDTANYPYINANPIYTWKNNNVWTHGTHTYKFGFFLERYQKNESFGSPVQGELSFSSGSAVTSGNGLADMYLGRIGQYTEGSAQFGGVAVGGYNKGHWRGTVFEPYFQDDWKVDRKLTLNMGVRYYLFVPIHDVSRPDTIDAAFEPSLYNPALEALLDANGNLVVDPATGNVATFQNYGNGLVQCGKGRIPSGCVEPSHGTIAPRFGFAWDPWGNGKTVLRGGYGIYYEYGNGNEANTEGLEGNPPGALSPSGFNIIGYDNIVPGAIGPPSISNLPARIEYPQVQQFNLTIEHELSGQNLLSVGYVGNLGRHLFREWNMNQVPLGATTMNVPALAGTTGCDASGNCDVQNILIQGVDPTIFFSPYRGYDSITMHENTAVSNYNALQVSLRHPFGHGLTAQVAYTYSHALDDSSNSSTNTGIDDTNLSRFYGTSDLNRAQVFVANYVYNLPFFKNASNPFVKQVLGGWTISGITTFFTGSPINFNCGVSGFSTGIGRSYRCNTVGNLQVLKGSTNDPEFGPTPTWFNPAVITQPLMSQLYANGEPGMFGYMGRNVLTGPGRNNTDFGLIKDFEFPWFGGEHSTLEFHGETFNTFNHPQWRSVKAGCSSSIGFGQPCTQTGNGEVSAAYNSRLVQFGLKFSF
ncbi:MAG TPA: carboxypeptidase-like regulatory domain-containing protein [Terriglobia bacterium]|nr:carboxypeptidase-like regulatory domain-containing protein [Terriglobia bacterium]